MKTMILPPRISLKISNRIRTAILLLSCYFAFDARAAEPGTDPLSAQQVVQITKGTYAALTSYSDEGQIIDGTEGVIGQFTTLLARTNLYRIQWVQRNNAIMGISDLGNGCVWSSGAGNFLRVGLGARWQPNREAALANAASPSAGASTIVPMTFFQMAWPGTLDDVEGNWTSLGEQSAGGVNCYVVGRNSQGRSMTLWIGKSDFLIRQIRVATSRQGLQAAAANYNSELARRLNGFTLVETHTNIVINHDFLRTDFTPASYDSE